MGERQIVGRERSGELEKIVKEMDWKWEKREREERKRNVLIRRMEVREEGRREVVEELMKAIEVKVELVEVKRLGGEREGEEEGG